MKQVAGVMENYSMVVQQGNIILQQPQHQQQLVLSVLQVITVNSKMRQTTRHICVQLVITVWQGQVLHLLIRVQVVHIVMKQD